MKAAVIFAVLIVWATSVQIRADENDPNASKSIPWTAHVSMGGFRLIDPKAIDGAAYQTSLYEGISFQPFKYIWGHAGLRTRETVLPNASQSLQQPADLKLGGMFELLPRHLYFSIGGNIPYRLDSAKIVDTLTYYKLFNGYNPFPEKDILLPGTVTGGVFGQYELPEWQIQIGLNATRFSSMELYPNKIFSSAPFWTFSTRLNHEIDKRILHRTDFRFTYFLNETDRVKNSTHQEGYLLQTRYGRKQLFNNYALEGDLGIALKWRDANRESFIPRPLLDGPFGDNYQKVYLEGHWMRRAYKTSAMEMYTVPQYFFTTSGESAWQAELGLKWKLKLGKNHTVLMQMHYLNAQFAGITYSGAGLNMQYSFQRIGVIESPVAFEGE